MRRIIFAIFWALIGTAALAIFALQAKSIGGVKYIVHAGLGWPALVEIYAAAISFIISFEALRKQRFAYELARITSWLLLLPFGAILLFGLTSGDESFILFGFAGILFTILNLARVFEEKV